MFFFKCCVKYSSLQTTNYLKRIFAQLLVVLSIDVFLVSTSFSSVSRLFNLPHLKSIKLRLHFSKEIVLILCLFWPSCCLSLLLRFVCLIYCCLCFVSMFFFASLYFPSTLFWQCANYDIFLSLSHRAITAKCLRAHATLSSRPVSRSPLCPLLLNIECN